MRFSGQINLEDGSFGLHMLNLRRVPTFATVQAFNDRVGPFPPVAEFSIGHSVLCGRKQTPKETGPDGCFVFARHPPERSGAVEQALSCPAVPEQRKGCSPEKSIVQPPPLLVRFPAWQVQMHLPRSRQKQPPASERSVSRLKSGEVQMDRPGLLSASEQRSMPCRQAKGLQRKKPKPQRQVAYSTKKPPISGSRNTDTPYNSDTRAIARAAKRLGKITPTGTKDIETRPPPPSP